MEAPRTTRYAHTRERRLNRRIVTFLICLALSALGWMLISLSQDYLERQQFKVVYSNLPEGIINSTLPDTVLVEYNASGFNLMFNDPLGKEFSIDCASASLSRNGQFHFMPASLVAKQFNKQFGGDFQIVRLLPDTIRMMLAGADGKRVSVLFAGKIKYKGEVQLVDSIQVIPYNILLVGDPLEYSSQNSISTLDVEFNAKEGLNSFRVKLRSPGNGVECVPDSVTIQFTTEKFTEREFMVPVTIVGLPAGYSFKPVPKEVKIRCLVPFSVLQEVGSLVFTATVDYSEISEKALNKVRVKISSNSNRLKNIRSQPESVDFILRKSN